MKTGGRDHRRPIRHLRRRATKAIGGGDDDDNARRRNAARALTIDRRRRAASIANGAVRGGNDRRRRRPVAGLRMEIHHRPTTIVKRGSDDITNASAATANGMEITRAGVETGREMMLMTTGRRRSANVEIVVIIRGGMTKNKSTEKRKD
jgi:hypothetical protein